MSRGSKPGERRGGRQRGTPNKKTLIKNAVFLAAAADPNRSPLDFMLALMRDPQVRLDLRIDMAAAAAPFVHSKPEPTRNKRPDPIDLRDRLGEAGDLKFAKLDARPDASADRGLNPLDFLLSVMSEYAATPEQRGKAAKVAARYTHACAGSEAPAVIVVEDKFGFKVDPELAQAERDDRVRENTLRVTLAKCKSPHEKKGGDQELEQIGKRRVERIALVSFPDNYTYDDRLNDQKRLEQLYSKRSSRRKLTPEEEAEEAHLAVRVLNPEAEKLVPYVPRKPEMEWPMSRIAELEERFVVGETPLSVAEQDELKDLRGRYPEIAADVDRLDHRYRYCVRSEVEKSHKAGFYSVAEALEARARCERFRDPKKMATLTELREGPWGRICELESLRFDKKLTPEEAQELEELHRLYPERAKRCRNLVVDRLYHDQLRREGDRRLGIDPGPIKDGEWPRIWTHGRC